MKVRAIDDLNDWTYGKGKSNYKKDILACAQMIKTELQSFLGDNFFATDAGIDWFNRMGGKNPIQFKLDVAAVILKVEGTISLEEITTTQSTNRRITIKYAVNTIYGRIANTLTQEI